MKTALLETAHFLREILALNLISNAFSMNLLWIEF
jgi:hypothetical protein